jgi:protein-S-isoprenylcysteine O-methyltransferase Ste14
MAALLSFLYGIGVYVLFLGTFLYAVAFVGNLPAPKTLDSGEAGPLAQSLLINVLLLAAFAIQHSTGPNAVGDIYVTTAGVLKICTVAGTPGTWVSVGAQ